MVADKRMYFVRNLDIPPEEKDEVEYEVTSDSRVISSYTSGDYNFTSWDAPVHGPGVYRRLILCIKEKTGIPADEFMAAKPTRKGFYHGGGIADEITALASLFLRVRFKLGPSVRNRGIPMIRSRGKHRLDSEIIKDNVNLEELNNSFELIVRLEDYLHLDFIMAVRFYHRALLYIDENPVTAYLDLISAIETLSKYADVGEPCIDWLKNEPLTEALGQVSDPGLRANIEKAILSLDQVKGFISKRFVKFILSNTSDDFWNRTPKDPNLPPDFYVENENIEKYLKRIYNTRSDYLHFGIPFPPFIFDAPHKNSELPPGKEMWTAERKWTEADVIPLPHFFERLVRHVLINFLRANQKDNDAIPR